MGLLESQRIYYDNRISRGLLNEKNGLDPAGEELEEVRTRDPDDDDENQLSRRLPQAMIIGVKKGGTRALLEYLRLHPDIVATGAEPHFFDQSYDKGLEYYRRMMPKSTKNQLTMEKTPAYFITKEVPARIYSMSKLTKLILVVRDPVMRAISDYTQALEKKPSIASFESLLFKNSSSKGINTEWPPIQVGLYAKHLVNWIQYFPMRRLLVVNGDRLIQNPAPEMSRIQEFLGVKKLITEKNFIFDEEKGFFCIAKAEENYKIPRCLGKNKGRAHPNIDEKALTQLKKFYKPYNKVFYQMIGEDFGWD